MMTNGLKAQPLTVHIEMDMSDIKAQIAEATELLKNVPESVARNFEAALLESVSLSSMEFGEPAYSAAIGAGVGALVFRPRFIGEFMRAVAALRAKKLDVV